MDDDNEVRDRATFYLSVLEQKQKALNAGYILNGILSSLFIAFLKKIKSLILLEFDMW